MSYLRRKFSIFNFQFSIAKRFIFSRGSRSVVNITSRVSMVAVGVPVAAMVILMSVFGGFDRLIREMYRGFDPDLMVVPAQGVVFERGVFDIGAIEGLRGVERTDWRLRAHRSRFWRGPI